MLYLHVCTQCGVERSTTKKHNPSGLCRSCSISQRHQASKRLRHFLPGSLYSQEDLARFWSKVDKETPCQCHPEGDYCWLWTARIDKTRGYACFSIAQLPIDAHRFAYQAEHGSLPDGVWVLHLPPCLMRHCVRHLYAGTPKDNSTDAKHMHRFPTGEDHAKLRNGYTSLPRGDNHWTHKQPSLVRHGKQHHNVRMTEESIVRMRKAYANGQTVYAIAKEYRCSYHAAKCIVRRITWKHVP